MRRLPILLLAVGLSLPACNDHDGPDPPDPSTGTLIVSTSTEGGDPDTDGYLLSVDDADSLHLEIQETTELDLTSGRHTLRLLGVADHCDVAPGTELEVDLPVGDTILVAFEVHCPPTPPTGAQITVATTGLDIDLDGYRVAVDGTDQGGIRASGALFIRLEPGTRTIELADLASNCTGDGPITVAVVPGEVTPVAFAVVCTATSGVIGIAFSGGGAGAMFEAVVDGGIPYPFDVSESGRGYVPGVPPGDHVIALTPADNCTVETAPQSVTVTAGGLIRDTVEVAFTVTCVTVARVTASTTGTIPAGAYSVWLCTINDSYYCAYGARRRLGNLDPNGTLVRGVTPGIHRFYLGDLPLGCHLVGHSPGGSHNPTDEIVFPAGLVHDVTFFVECSG